MKIHDINSVLAVQLSKTTAMHQFKTAKFFEHRLENLRDFLAEAHNDPDFAILDATGRPHASDYDRRCIAFAVAFGDREAAGKWAYFVAGQVYSAFSLENGGTERSIRSKLNPTAVGTRLGELHRAGMDYSYARLILSESQLSSALTEAWREGVPFEYLNAFLEHDTVASNAIEVARQSFKDGMPLEYGLALMA